jgi:hypothetical protein
MQDHDKLEKLYQTRRRQSLLRGYAPRLAQHLLAMQINARQRGRTSATAAQSQQPSFLNVAQAFGSVHNSARGGGHVRTTLDLDARLVRDARAQGLLESKTLTRIIEEGLALWLASRRSAPERGLPEFKTSKLTGGFTSRISDPSSNREIYDAADESGRIA